MKQMFQFVPKTETRFWKLFRNLLIPLGIASFIICLICGIAAASGESAVNFDGRAITGWQGLLFSFGIWPLVTILFTLVAAWTLFMERKVEPAVKKFLMRCLFFWRRK